MKNIENEYGLSFQFTKIRDVKSPLRGTDESAGIDFFIPNKFNHGVEYLLTPGDAVLVPSGIKLIIPKGFSGNFYNKSSIGSRGIIVGAQVVDSDYRGEVHLNVINVSNQNFVLQPGMKLTQMLIQPILLTTPQEIKIEEYEIYKNTQRGSGGFGSTGDK